MQGAQAMSGGQNSPKQVSPPLVFTHKQRGAMRLCAVDRSAQNLGLIPGLTLADARARVPHLEAVDSDPVADRNALEAIADFCDRYTPMVALEGKDRVVLDITGCAHLFNGEAAMRADVEARCVTSGLDVVSAIAATPDCARALACFGRGGMVEEGKERQALGPLPVDALGLGLEVHTALKRAGLVFLSHLLDRPRGPLAARFGEALPRTLSRLLAQEDIGIVPRRPLPPCTVERRFADPIGRDDDVLACAHKLMEQAASMLEARGQGGRLFELSLFRTDGALRRLAVETSQIMRAADPVLRLFRERVDTLADPLDPGFGYDMIRLSVDGGAALQIEQTSLDDTQEQEADLAALVDQLTTRLGKDAVQRFISAQSHIPERAAYQAPASDVLAYANLCQERDLDGTTTLVDKLDLQWDAPSSEDPPHRPIQLFDHPQRIEALAQIPDGPPLKFRWRRVLHEIARAEGPERIAPEWWRLDDMSLTRDYYRVEDGEGRRFWVFREGLYGEQNGHPSWFVHGLFA